MRLLIMFDLPTETTEDRRRYRKLIKVLEQDGFYRLQYSVFVRVCASNADIDAIKIRLRGILANYPGEIKSLALTDKQFTHMEQINWKQNEKQHKEVSASTKRMVVI